MATTYYNDIQKLYVAYFNRPADPAGLAAWETVLEGAKDAAGVTKLMGAISAAFAGSAEYKAAYANMTNTQIVDQVYKNLFGHGAVGVDDAGLKYWVDLLDKKALTIDNVVSGIAGGALGTDKIAYDSKVAFATTFTAAVDTDAEKAGYSGDAANAAAKKVMAGITDAATLAAASAPGTLSASVASVVAAGTPFSVASSLASYQAAQAAMTNFLDAYDGKADGTVTKTATDVAAAVTTAEGKVGAYVTGGATAYNAASTAVKAALVSDAVASYNKALADAQTAVTKANAAIAKVDGLTSAEATLAAAKTATDNATKADLAAAADLNAKLASYNTIHGTNFSAAADGTVSDGTTTLIKLNSSNNLVLNTNVDEDHNSGITAVLSATTAKEAADSSLTKAMAAQDAAQTQVNYLDMGTTEVNDLTAIKATMATYKDVTIATDALPTEAQMQTELAILKAKSTAAGATATDVSNYNNFKTAVDTYHTDAAANALTADLDTATTAVKTASDNITALNKAVTGQAAAYSDATQLDALQKAIDAAGKVLTSHDLTLPVNAGGSQLATAASDIFVANGADATISLFGLLGNDSLYVGQGYTLNTGKLSAGSDSALEVFVSQNGSDTKLVIEKHAFSSHVTGAVAPELVTITLVGVDASTVHMNNGIITVGTGA